MVNKRETIYFIISTSDKRLSSFFISLNAASERSERAATLIVTVSLWSMHTISHLD